MRYKIIDLAIIKHLPNFLTLCNLLCGCIGIWFALENRLDIAAYLIWLAAVFDFFDGFVARWLKAYSDIGKELDSLADMVTFGVLPSFIMLMLLKGHFEPSLLPWIAFLIAAFSALRLAKFNVDTRQSDSFIGLPTPANALFISALPLVIAGNSYIGAFLNQGVVLVAISVIFSLLLVAEFRLFALKFKNFSWQDNKIRFIFIAFCLILLPIFQLEAIPLLIILYLILSIPGSRGGL